jgi:hypothetical protein
MLTALMLSSLFAAAGDTYLIQWESQKHSPEQLALEDGQLYKRTKKLSKQHVRAVFALRATGTKDGRVRLDADLHDGDKPVHVTLITKLDQPVTLPIENGAMRVRVHKTPDEMAFMDLVAP